MYIYIWFVVSSSAEVEGLSETLGGLSPCPNAIMTRREQLLEIFGFSFCWKMWLQLFSSVWYAGPLRQLTHVWWPSGRKKPYIPDLFWSPPTGLRLQVATLDLLQWSTTCNILHPFRLSLTKRYPAIRTYLGAFGPAPATRLPPRLLEDLGRHVSARSWRISEGAGSDVPFAVRGRNFWSC